MTTTFLGMKVNGDITRSDKKDQRPIAEFGAVLAAALAQPGVTEIRWDQYTPYFNDGEPCVFSARFPTFVVDGVEAEDFPYHDNESRMVLGTREIVWHRGSRVEGPYSGPNEDRYDALSRLQWALVDGEFDDALLAQFGDHATVRVVPHDGIYVESVDHD